MEIGLLIGLILIGVLMMTFADSEISTSAVPLPPTEALLPVITAEPWVQIDDSPEIFLEGPAFDREGNLFVSSIFDSRILKITPDKKVSTIFSQEGLLPDGMAIHKDGRLFVVCISGKLVTVNLDGSNMTEIEARYEGKPAVMNDIVFDNKGNFYVTDFTGSVADPTGGLYRFSSDLKTVEPVIEHLASANGVAISPEGDVLWVAETTRNSILRLELMEDGVTVNPFVGATIPYLFMGSPGGPDSNAVDAAGNLCQCVIFQGRILILNKSGLPLANVLIPGRDVRKHLRTTDVAFKPGTNEAVITTSGEGGAWIYKFQGLAEGLRLFSHQ